MRNAPAFTFLELMLTIGIIGVMIPILLRFMPKPSLYEWEGVTPSLNRLAVFARAQALQTQKKHRLAITHDPKRGDKVELERLQTVNGNRAGEFVPVLPRSLAEYRFPLGVQVADLRSHGKDLLGQEKRTVSLYISPEGYFEQATIDLTRTVDNQYDRKRLQLEPLLGQFIPREVSDVGNR